ncbi:hypothetical protein [Listeria cornellensis]|uniref:Uncharacterized protein n=1 Tax=Listeria cornellensis FSL F6-0969 TaxID=1265820 RepID=W7C264_9LIST|nr:hypothetical protein [Listeria cornellensis]EUJ26718.1 hypothetical protein PCORN_14434 [Listeria cornellensis FSL F6-0969]
MFASEHGGHSSGGDESISEEQVEQLISNYDRQDEVVNGDSTDERYVNDMVLKQEETMSEIEQIIAGAEKRGEKLYTQEEILNLSAKKIGISESDMEQVKESISQEQKELDEIKEVFENIGEADHPIVEQIIEEQQDFKIPFSLIYIDHEQDTKDGVISGGGWPYCLDDNGYGYRNFITSDCYKALVFVLVCMLDSTAGKKWPNLRYCKAYTKNCSPLIGHSKYKHSHAWWQRIP